MDYFHNFSKCKWQHWHVIAFFREISEEKLKCVTNPSPDVAKNLDLIVGFDSFRQTLPASFSFEENPEVSSELFLISPLLVKWVLSVSYAEIF